MKKTSLEKSIADVPGKCRVCGCEEHRPCSTAIGECFWIEDNFCSACALVAEKPDVNHAVAFSLFFADTNPLLGFHINSHALIRLLIAKGVINDAEMWMSFMQETRRLSEPIEPPGTIIIPGTNIDLKGMGR